MQPGAKFYLPFLYFDIIGRFLLGRGKSCCLLTSPDLPMSGTLRMVGPMPKTAPSNAIEEITAPPVVSSLRIEVYLKLFFYPPDFESIMGLNGH